jgi:hypothetical protein
MSGGAYAQSPTATAGVRDCADFDTQEAAQQYFDQNKSATNPNPDQLDTDGDGKACEGLPTSATATTSPAATTAPTASPTTTGTLPQNGAETGVIALSGLSLLEAGYGLTLASKRLGIRRRAIPLYLIRKFAHAARRGEGHIEVGEDMYLVHRSVLETGPIAPIAPVPEVAPDEPLHTPELFDLERVEEPTTPAGQRPNVYAALARPTATHQRDA